MWLNPLFSSPQFFHNSTSAVKTKPRSSFRGWTSAAASSHPAGCRKLLSQLPCPTLCTPRKAMPWQGKEYGTRIPSSAGSEKGQSYSSKRSFCAIQIIPRYMLASSFQDLTSGALLNALLNLRVTKAGITNPLSDTLSTEVPFPVMLYVFIILLERNVQRSLFGFRREKHLCSHKGFLSIGLKFKTVHLASSKSHQQSSPF